jgi:hypothetical protein
LTLGGANFDAAEAASLGQSRVSDTQFNPTESLLPIVPKSAGISTAVDSTEWPLPLDLSKAME